MLLYKLNWRRCQQFIARGRKYFDSEKLAQSLNAGEIRGDVEELDRQPST